MRLAVLAVLFSLAVVLAGCPTDADAQRTLTPAEVPAVPTEPPTPTPLPDRSVECDVPSPPPASDVPADQRSGTASIPVEDGLVNASAMVERHERVLANYRYRLAASDRSIYVTENRSAFLATVRIGVATISHYAIEGTRYTYYFEDGGRARYGVAEHVPSPSTRVFGESISLTGGPTIERVLAAYPHRVETVRDDGWRVLRATVDDLEDGDVAGITALNSTVLVDRRGIVRRVETRVATGSTAGDPSTENVSLWIRQVGEAEFTRPDWVCTAAGLIDGMDGRNGTDAPMRTDDEVDSVGTPTNDETGRERTIPDTRDR